MYTQYFFSLVCIHCIMGTNLVLRHIDIRHQTDYIPSKDHVISVSTLSVTVDRTDTITATGLDAQSHMAAYVLGHTRPHTLIHCMCQLALSTWLFVLLPLGSIIVLGIYREIQRAIPPPRKNLCVLDRGCRDGNGWTAYSRAKRFSDVWARF